MMDLDRILGLFRALDDERVAYVVVGAVALNLHGLVRATEDVDLFVREDPDNVERLKRALHRVWNDSDIEEITASDLSGEYAVIRYGPPDEDLVIDLISRLGSAFRYEDVQAEVVEIQGVPVRVATPSMLYRMKRDTLRPIDQIDAQSLKEHFGIGED